MVLWFVCILQEEVKKVIEQQQAEQLFMYASV